MIENNIRPCNSKVVKFFFAHDKLNYARMIPVYLADMMHSSTLMWTSMTSSCKQTGSSTRIRTSRSVLLELTMHWNINHSMKVSAGMIAESFLMQVLVLNSFLLLQNLCALLGKLRRWLAVP